MADILRKATIGDLAQQAASRRAESQLAVIGNPPPQA
jgi:hypothetical protein